MRVIYGIGPLEHGPRQPKVVTVGVFDGVHRGHRRVLRYVRHAARKGNRVSAVVTFARHPSRTLSVTRSVRHLTSLTHKLLLLEREGIDCCYVLEFNRAMARLSPEAFVRDILVRRLKTAALYVGEDFVFGRGAKGDVATLGAAARRFGFRFFALRHSVAGGRVISSTRIRELVERGDLAAARRLLGRRVSLLGVVVRGEGRGRKLGFPTANLCVEHEALVPDGVYAARGRLVRRTGCGTRGARFARTEDGTRFARWRPCVAYVGRKPTFHRNAGRVVEVYFWQKGVGRLRGRLLEVEFIRRLRPDRRFAAAKDLMHQMHRDVLLVKRILKGFF